MKKLLYGALLFAPALTFAQSTGSANLTNIENLARSIGRIINILIPIVAALALLYFFWGLAQFILHSGEDDAREKAKGQMIWGIVALFVIVAVWGLVGFIADALGLGSDVDNPAQQDIPSVDITPDRSQ
jgi:amino acid transporter